MSDLFHENVPEDFIRQVWAVMCQATQHTFQVLTKRPERMRDIHRKLYFINAPNIWLGISVENQSTAEKRIPILLDTPATHRFLSCEPLLEELKIGYYLNFGNINWVFVVWFVLWIGSIVGMIIGLLRGWF